jgi:dTDP-4-amino-4,6-dideoxy-D-galactose acyltransferase
MSAVHLDKTDIHYEILDWDSQFFAFGVARFSRAGADLETLSAQLAELKQRQVRLVYWPVPHGDEASCAAALSCGGRMVGCQVTYAQAGDGPDVNANAPFTEYKEVSANQELIALAIRSGEFSRYSNDPQIKREKFEELYLNWINNCTAKKTADHILIENSGGGMAGMVCVKKSVDEGKIILIAVNDEFQGAGIGTKLVRGALSLGKQLGCTSHSVVTYNENVAACKLFEKCGYTPREKSDYYHFWL